MESFLGGGGSSESVRTPQAVCWTIKCDVKSKEILLDYHI